MGVVCTKIFGLICYFSCKRKIDFIGSARFLAGFEKLRTKNNLPVVEVSPLYHIHYIIKLKVQN